MRKYCLIWGMVFLCVLILSGCGKLDRKGTPAANSPPQVYFADIPPEGYKFSIKPRIYWFGTDVDGFVTAYQYAVVIQDSVINPEKMETMRIFLHGIASDSASWVDQLSLKHIIGAHVRAEPGGHSKNVMMYADMNPDVYTPQYLFLRAVDNTGAVSDSIIYRMFSRNNHRPEAFIDMDSATRANFEAKGHYCLRDTTTTWKGISISWSGLDTADYKDKRNQPEFQFKWELVGPFSDSSSVFVDTQAVVDSSLDSIYAAGEWIYSRWVAETIHVFKGLENFGDSGYGWYQLRVRTRDDAFVSTDSVTKLNFRILKPRFRYADQGKKTILVVDATAYSGPDGGALDTAHVRPFYRDAFSQAGLCDEFRLWYDTLTDHGPDYMGKNVPVEDVLSRYDLVVLLNVGSRPAITNDNYGTYKEYLDIGGRLWIIGLNNFNMLCKGRLGLTYFAEIKAGAPIIYDLGTSYFGLEAVFVPCWTVLDSMTLEFVQANPFGDWEDLPTLKADTLKCRQIKGYVASNPVQNFGTRGIPHVCYDALSNNLDFEHRIPAERRIYTFISYYGSLSPMHDTPCAVNYIGPMSRTVEFSFPLNLMENKAPDYPVNEVIRRMVDWFWEDLP